MATNEASTITVGPHEATFIPKPIVKKKAYVPPGKREVGEQPELKMDDKTFPSLNTQFVPLNAPPPLNYIKRIKAAEAKRDAEAEEESLAYDSTKFATMTKKQLAKEGWEFIAKNSGAESPPRGEAPEEVYSPNSTAKQALPIHPDMYRRRLVSKKPSYTDLYDLDYSDSHGAVVPTIHDEEDDGESSV